jgi:HEAT repeat protein
VKALGRLQATDAIPDLLAILSDRKQDGALRVAVAEALGFLGNWGAAAVPALLATLTEFTVGDRDQDECAGPEDEDDWLRTLNMEIHQHAALSLGAIGVEADVVVPALVRALDAECPNLREGAMKGLAKLGPKARSALRRLRALDDIEAMLAVDAIEGE